MGMSDLVSMQGVDHLVRWSHLLFGITWIGLLYYFNFVQAEYFKEAADSAKTDAFTKLVPRALWWFRWGAMFTVISGFVLLGIRGAGLTIDIALGTVMGLFMWLNVWFIIWPNQKILIASNEQVVAGGMPLAEAAIAAPKAALASRTNTFLSIPLLFFMGSSAHFPQGLAMHSDSYLGLVLAVVIVAAIEANAIVGKMGPLATVRGVITSGLLLTLVLYAVVSIL